MRYVPTLFGVAKGASASAQARRVLWCSCEADVELNLPAPRLIPPRRDCWDPFHGEKSAAPAPVILGTSAMTTRFSAGILPASTPRLNVLMTTISPWTCSRIAIP